MANKTDETPEVETPEVETPAVETPDEPEIVVRARAAGASAGVVALLRAQALEIEVLRTSHEREVLERRKRDSIERAKRDYPGVAAHADVAEVIRAAEVKFTAGEAEKLHTVLRAAQGRIARAAGAEIGGPGIEPSGSQAEEIHRAAQRIAIERKIPFHEAVPFAIGALMDAGEES